MSRGGAGESLQMLLLRIHYDAGHAILYGVVMRKLRQIQQIIKLIRKHAASDLLLGLEQHENKVVVKIIKMRYNMKKVTRGTK